MSILSSQADPLTFKNVGSMKAAARFSKNHGFGSKDALDGVLGLSWAHFGCFWGLLGGSFGVCAGFRWHLACSKLLFGLPSWPNLLLFFVSAFAPFFEVIVSLILEPLRVDLELSS